MRSEPPRTSLAKLIALAALTVACMGCGDAKLDVDPEPAPLPSAPPISWSSIGQVTLNEEGTSALASLNVPSQARFAALRVIPSWPVGANPKEPPCYTLDGLWQDDAVWIEPEPLDAPVGPVCRACSQRVTLGHGFGSFAFPNDGSEWDKGFALKLRVALRQCESYVPLHALSERPDSLSVEFATEVKPAASQSRAALQLRVAISPQTVLSGDSAQALWDGGTKRLAALYAEAGIELHIERRVEVEPPLDTPLVFGPGNMSALDAYFRRVIDALETPGEAESRFVPVVVVPCLQTTTAKGATTRLRGISPRIPGGLRGGTEADAVFISAGQCDVAHTFASGDELGLLLAHELGHYLGLYHADTSDGAHLLDAPSPLGSSDIMNRDVESLDPERAGLSPAAKVVVRSHPAVYFIE